MLGCHPNMLLIGATAKDVGKTELTCRIINKFHRENNISAIKVTVIDKPDAPYSRIEGNYVITEETDSSGTKDTCRMLVAGAGRVLWLRVMRGCLEEGAKALLKMMDDNATWVCESNSIRQFVKPGVFLIVTAEGENDCKPSAEQMSEHADCIVVSSPQDSSFNLDFDRLNIENNKWALRENASAAVLAGGQSSRMGTDKGMLAVDDKSMIEHIVEQLRGHFDELLISSGKADDYSFLGLPVVTDTETGRGPLMGIASVLENSSRDLNFITACDVPDVNMSFVRRMLKKAVEEDLDVVVPQGSDGRLEPLHAIYNKRVAVKAKDILNAGEGKVMLLFEQCMVGYIELSSFELWNLNTTEDYDKYRRGEGQGNVEDAI